MLKCYQIIVFFSLIFSVLNILRNVFFLTTKVQTRSNFLSVTILKVMNGTFFSQEKVSSFSKKKYIIVKPKHAWFHSEFKNLKYPV